jgi:hypothetical protein
MSQLGSVRVTVIVGVEPAVAFQVFTEEIDTWYRRGLAESFGRKRATGLRFEPWVGGRLLEHRAGGEDGGDGLERARVTVWDPPARLVFVDQRDTEVDVRFEAAAGGTRVVLEHRGLDRLPPGVAADLGRFGWRRLAEWFERHLEGQRT